MKIRILFIISFASIRMAYCQQQTVLAKFVIEIAQKNGIDLTNFYTSTNSYFVVYLTADNHPYFGSIVSKQNQQSYGPMTELVQSHEPETSKSYSTDTFNFKWSYSNSFDNDQGVATVQLTKINKPGGIAFKLRIIPKNLDLYKYSGYMEGSLSLN